MKNKRIFITILILLFIFILFRDIDVYAANSDNTEEIKIYMSRVVKDGVYYITCSQDTNYVLDIEEDSLENGANLDIWTKKDSANQKFYIEYDGGGYYKIYNVNSAKVIDVDSASEESGANVQQYESNNSSAQRWKIRKNIDGTYNFIAECSGKALDVEDSQYKDGTNISQYTYTNTYNQRFKLESTELLNEGIVSIRKADNSNVAIDIPNATSEEGQNVEVYETNGGISQKFELQRVGENEVRIRTAASGGWLKEESSKEGANVIQSGNSETKPTDADTWKVEWNEGIVLVNKESGLCLTVKDNSSENNAEVIVMPKDGSDSQSFLVTEEDLIKEGWYEIESKLGKMMDLSNSGSDLGTNIDLYEKNNQNNQKFKIVKQSDGYVIYTMHNLALDVENASMEDGANIRQWEDNGALCQRWIPEIKDGGYISFKNANSGKYINVENGSTENGANIEQYTGNDSDSQLWKLTETTFVTGWVSKNGQWYCYDPQTGQLVTNCTRVDPMMTDPAQYGSLYDFDSEGRATWHLPVVEDLPGGTGPDAPLPTLTGDRRQRVLQLALSRLGCPYEAGNAPTGFVCDGLTAWSYTTALGDWFNTGPGSREDLQDASWQWDKIKNRNGIKYDRSQLRSGDLVFFGNPQLTQGPGMIDFDGEEYHAGIYYKDDIMINARSGGVDLYSVSGYYMDWLGGGSPYEAETSRVEIHH